MDRSDQIPAQLLEAQKSLKEKLGGVNVATAHGLGDDMKGPPRWLLYVFTDGPRKAIPKNWEGFDVCVRGVPKTTW